MDCELCGQPITDATNSKLMQIGCCGTVYVHNECPTEKKKKAE